MRQPEWDQFAPPEPTRLARVFGVSKRHQELVSQRQADFRQACADSVAEEAARQQASADAQRRHARRAAAHAAKAAEANAEADRLEQGFAARQPEVVEDYFELVIETSPVPDDVPVDVEVAYQAEARRLYVLHELPTVDIIPDVQEYRYIRTRDETDAKARPVKEIRQRYADLVAQLVLLTIRDVFDVAPHDLVDEVALNGHVSTRNKATGQPERPCLVSVTAKREQFEQLVLGELDPIECLRHLNALVSPYPHDMEAVRPIFDPDLTEYRFIDEVDIAAGLDGRQVLVDLKPGEFEHLVRQLFEAMGMKSWVTWASHDFAARHGRIQLIEGPELKHLVREHLGKDVVIGVQKGKAQPS